MSVRTLMVVVLALVCGGSAAVGVSQLTKNRAEVEKIETVDVLIAATNVPRGAILSDEHLKIKAWPSAMLPAGALTKTEEAVGHSVTVPLVAGELVLQAKLAAEGSQAGLASLITRGMRAFTISTPKVSSGVGGFIQPGNNVDVLLTTRSSGRNDPTGGGATTTLLQNVQVLAVDKFLDGNDSEKVDARELKSVTLLVTPDQAAKLNLGMNEGELHLALRNPEDDEEAITRPATLAELRFHQGKPNQDASGLGKVVSVLASAITGSGAASAPADAPAAEESEKPRRHVAHIQTMRGVHRGSIRIEK